MEVITGMAKKEIGKLTKEDMVVVWGGANNIAKNESDNGLTYISNFVKQRRHMNIVTVSAPNRHNLLATPCVNGEVTGI